MTVSVRVAPYGLFSYYVPPPYVPVGDGRPGFVSAALQDISPVWGGSICLVVMTGIQTRVLPDNPNLEVADDLPSKIISSWDPLMLVASGALRVSSFAACSLYNFVAITSYTFDTFSIEICPPTEKVIKPTHYFPLLRVFFRSTGGGGWFELLYKEVLALLREMLYLSEMVSELCLTNLLDVAPKESQRSASGLRTGTTMLSYAVKKAENWRAEAENNDNTVVSFAYLLSGFH
ncbi:uncharacterized protein EV420DRAFT_1485136 [Desarmillaria tabescens]|uniref:Uncharacterized protein n=1 Tax=Armillaria tabescens TaxID=1929756 RepID=A0AA39MR73_ARMTA|nr:uncharacterized protein EV420DRAFT_1485136 [Desarmillaria tabescens]KAK0443029.1 hypothetical protein EV420DRAFT_1485136 [Desarmillaria tabescens]